VLLEQDAGVVVPVLRRLGVDPAVVRRALGSALDSLPNLSGQAVSSLVGARCLAALSLQGPG
jgi:Clp amino terminal domain, pathogenicity island component